MSLAPGTRLGHYQITALLGEGGMGAVYRATDTSLGRDVAIKVLPDAWTADASRLARFEREARTLALLNHPNIATIYGFEQWTGRHALVMELVEGDDLSARIARGPMPWDELLPVARSIVAALEAAHERGIVHRDLKPANIKVRPDGTVKVLDFGLAKATRPDEESAVADGSSSTLTGQGLTRVGAILGTAAYMAPEQARGQAVDRRCDIWALGVVLFEMSTGTRPFDGVTASDTLASILTKTPPWAAVPASTPPAIRRLLHRCLEPDLQRRLQAVGDARLEIDDAASGVSDPALPTSPAGPVARWSRWLPWAVAASAVAAVVVLRLATPAAVIPASPWHLSAELGANVSLPTTQGAATVLSPDGSTMAFAGSDDSGTTQLFVRRLDQLAATALQGTAGADSPFFSPDGKWIAFFADQKLKKVSVEGGTVITICEAPDTRGGSWGDDGTIVFSPSTGGGLKRVSSAGGTPVELTPLLEGQVTQRWPQLLPGGKAVLYSGHTNTSGFDNANLIVQPLPTGRAQTVQTRGYYGRYIPSGHLLFLHDGTLFAAPFDLGRLERTGEAAPVIEGVTGNTFGGGQFAVSTNGTLAYLQGQVVNHDVPMFWIDHNGAVTVLRRTPSNWSNPSFSPDGRRVAMDISDGRQTDIWIYDISTDTPSRLTFDPADDQKPIWTPDGQGVVFSSRRDGNAAPNLYWQRADGSGDAVRLTTSRNRQLAAAFRPDGSVLAFSEFRSGTSEDVMLLPMTGDTVSGWKPGEPTVFLGTPSAEFEPMFSPDGRWLAYMSTETGRFEVFVRPFPDPGGKWQISTIGGLYPTWSRARAELFFSSVGGQLMVVPFVAGSGSFRAQAPRTWTTERIVPPVGPGRTFDLHPDGTRFAVGKPSDRAIESAHRHVALVFGFFEELRRTLGPATR